MTDSSAQLIQQSLFQTFVAQFGEAILRLSAAITLEDLRKAVRDAIKLTLPSSCHTVLYLRNFDSLELVSHDQPIHQLPHVGIAREAVESGRRIVRAELPIEDPLAGLLLFDQASGQTLSGGNFCIVCSPVIEPESDTTVAVVVTISASPLSTGELVDMEFFERQLAICYRRINLSRGKKPAVVSRSRLQKAVSVPSGDSNVKSHMSSASYPDILALCVDLHDADATTLQGKINRYLKDHTGSSAVFCCLLSPRNSTVRCSVVDQTVLPEEIAFDAVACGFNKICEQRKLLFHTDLTNEQLEQVTRLSGVDRLSSCLLFPVVSRTTGETMMVCCLAKWSWTGLSGDEETVESLGRNGRGACGGRESSRGVSLLGCTPCCQRRGADPRRHASPDRRPPPPYTDADCRLVEQCFSLTAPILINTLACEAERALKIQTEALLRITKNLFTHLDDLTILLKEIMQEARNLTKAERCSVFLLDKDSNELVAKVFDGQACSSSAPASDVPGSPPFMSGAEIRIPATEGIAGHVATTGELLNIRDAYSHPLFFRKIDDLTGYRTRNILCFPIKNDRGQVVGVAQLCNKLDGQYFNAFDEDIAQSFAIFCCISIVHSLMYRQANEERIRSKLSNELMTYHMQVSNEEVNRLNSDFAANPANIYPEIAVFSFPPRSVPEFDTPRVVLSMYEDLGFIQKFRLRQQTLCRFTLMIRRGYRDPPYHNWMHAFSVAHFCYLLFKNYPMQNNLTDLERFSLFTACLCHDIDHRGTNNSFQVASGSKLAALYSSEGSVMERHHFAQTMCILNSDGCNVLENLPTSQYERALDLIRDIILATDLATHLRLFPTIRQMIQEGYNVQNPQHHSYLLSLLMTCCDLSDQTKSWENSREIAKRIYSEFFSQGEMEKQLGYRPVESMDRERACIPKLQIGFLDGIVIPLFQTLNDLIPVYRPFLDAISNNRVYWQVVLHKYQALIETNSTEVDVYNIDVSEADLLSVA